MKKIPSKPSPLKKKKNKYCSRCKNKIKDDSDWQILLGNLFCEKCVDGGILFGAPKKEKKNKYIWKDPVGMRQYWNQRYSNDPKRHDLCSCGAPKQKNSKCCPFCRNQNIMFSEEKHLRDFSGRFIKIPKRIRERRNASLPILFLY